MEPIKNDEGRTPQNTKPDYQNLSTVGKRIEVIEYYLAFIPDCRIGAVKLLIDDEGLQESILKKRCDYILAQINQSLKNGNYENTK